MRRARALLFVVCAGMLAAFPVRGMDLAEIVPWLARVQVDLKGNYTPVEGRELDWSVSWAEPVDAARRGEIVVAGPALALRVALEFSVAERRLRWRVIEGRVDVGAWLSALAERPDLAEMLAGVSATGDLVITGEGHWAGDAPDGRWQVAWADGTIANAEQGWSLEGISIQAGGDVAELVGGRAPVRIDVRTITTGRFGARALEVRAVLSDAERIEISSATVEVAGGRVNAAPFAVTLAEPKLDVNLTMERVGLQDVAQLVPETLSGARGRVNGAARISWSEGDGFALGEGWLSLDASEVAEVRFRSNPGLLTGSLPALVLKHYPGLTKLETGESPLLAARFDVRFSPEGDADGRSATVKIEGGPVDPTLKAPLVFTVNVRGPLGPLIKFGTTSGMGLGDDK